MKKNWIGMALIATAYIGASSVEAAVTTPNDTITAIFGNGGNPNTGWYSVTDNDIELALRGKNRSDGTTPNDGNGTYTLPLGMATPTRSYTQFEFHANVDADNSGGSVVSDYSFQLWFDTDPTQGQSFVMFDPLALYSDNSFGTSATLAAQGQEIPALASSSTIFQNSQNGLFFPMMYDPFEDATYSFRFDVLGDNDVVLNSVSIDIDVGEGGGPAPVPEPSTVFGGIAIVGMMAAKRFMDRKKS